MTGENFNAEMMKILGDIIKNNLPPPNSKDAKEGKEAWKIAEKAIKSASNERMKLAITQMTIALRSGVPEPVNSHLRSLLIKLIDQQINHNINYNKNNKHLSQNIKV